MENIRYWPASKGDLLNIDIVKPEKGKISFYHFCNFWSQNLAYIASVG